MRSVVHKIQDWKNTKCLIAALTLTTTIFSQDNADDDEVPQNQELRLTAETKLPIMDCEQQWAELSTDLLPRHQFVVQHGSGC